MQLGSFERDFQLIERFHRIKASVPSRIANTDGTGQPFLELYQALAVQEGMLLRIDALAHLLKSHQIVLSGCI
jgi:hypothetical protein